MLGAGRRTAKSASMVENASGAIMNGVLGAAWRLPESASMVAYVHRQRFVTSRTARGQKSSKRAHIVANAYGFIVRGALGAERRVPKSASIVASAHGAIVKSVLREAWCVLKSASMVAYDNGTHLL